MLYLQLLPAKSPRKDILWRNGQINYQIEPLSKEQFEEWKKQGLFKDGLAIIMGKIWRGKNAGKFLTCVDLDNELAIKEFFAMDGVELHWENITLVEGREGRLHVYIVTDSSIPDKNPDNTPEIIEQKKANTKPAIEIKGSSQRLMYPTPNRGYCFQGTAAESADFSDNRDGIIQHIEDVCKKHELKYLEKVEETKTDSNNDNNDKHPNDGHPKRPNNISLSNSEVKQIVNLWGVYYKPDNRHHVSFSLCGLCCKSYLTRESTRAIIATLCDITNDKQKSSRLNDVETTYRRWYQNEEIQGASLLAQVLGDDIVEVLAKFNRILEQHENTKTSSPLKLTRKGSLLELIIENQTVSIIFTPNLDLMFNSVMEKVNTLGLAIDTSDLTVQLSEIIKNYNLELEETKTPAERLLSMLRCCIKESFRDETNMAYIVIDENGHNKILNLDTTEFDEWSAHIYEEANHLVLSHTMIKNTKRVVRANIKNNRVLHNRVARIDNILYYNLSGKAVEITSKGWKVIDDPCIFRRSQPQIEPVPITGNKRYLQEIFSTCSIKRSYQKLLLEVYTIALFVESIQHPIITPIGPAGSGKSMLFELMYGIIDPHPTVNETSLKKLPSDEKDRRVSIYHDYLSLFDNLTNVSHDIMDDLCMWVTGYSSTDRLYYTNNEATSLSGTRPIGVNGINIPVYRPDILDRAFIIEMEKQLPPNITPKSEMFASLEQKLPEILGHIFDTLVTALATYNDIRKEITPQHRLADFMIWGEVISRALGNVKNAFVEAWMLNVQNQNQVSIDNSLLAQLVIGHIFEQQQNPINIEPQKLFKEIKSYAVKQGIEYRKPLPQSPSWLSRSLNEIKDNLKQAGIHMETGSDLINRNERYIRFEKIS